MHVIGQKAHQRSQLHRNVRFDYYWLVINLGCKLFYDWLPYMTLSEAFTPRMSSVLQPVLVNFQLLCLCTVVCDEHTRFVIPVVFCDITNVQCVYWSDTTVFIGRI